MKRLAFAVELLVALGFVALSAPAEAGFVDAMKKLTEAVRS